MERSPDIERVKETITREYKILRIRKKGRFKVLFEDLARFAGNVFKLKISEKERSTNLLAIRMLDLDVEPHDFLSLALLVLITCISLSFLLVLISPLSLILIPLGILAFFWIRNYPKRMLEQRMIRNSSELVSLVLYLVVYMRHVPNLENALKFAAENLGGDIGNDLKKLIWDTQARKYADIQEALESYVLLWRGINPDFADSIYLIISSLYQADEGNRLALLDEAASRMIEGTYTRMVQYASALRNPINTIYMLGIILPILGMVMFPMIMAMSNFLFDPIYLVIFYNIILPAFVYYLLRGTLKKRPSGFPSPKIEEHPYVAKKHCFLFKGRNIPAIAPAIIIGILISVPFILWLQSESSKLLGETQIYMSLIFTLAVAAAVYSYVKLVSFQKIKILKRIYNIEKDIGDAIFQLGTHLSEGFPPEQSVERVAMIMKHTEISDFFKMIVMNIKRLGLSFSDAIFHRKYGAINFFPSPLIKTSAKILLETSKKSLQHAGVSLIYLARHLRNLKTIDNRVYEVLDEVLSSMRFQITFLAPVISATVVGLTTLITLVLASLSEHINALANMSVGTNIEGAALTPFTLGIFKLSGTIPLHVFQIVVGIYTIEIAILIGFAVANIEKPGDANYRNAVIAGVVMRSMLIYIFLTAISTLILGGLGRMALGITEVIRGVAGV